MFWYCRNDLLSAVLALALTGGSAYADKVTLELKDGGYTVNGRLEAFDGQEYEVLLEGIGVVPFRAPRFDCVAGACPAKKDLQRKRALTNARRSRSKARLLRKSISEPAASGANENVEDLWSQFAE